MPLATAVIVPPGSFVVVSMSTVPLQPVPATLHVPCRRYEKLMFPTRVFGAASKSFLIVSNLRSTEKTSPASPAGACGCRTVTPWMILSVMFILLALCAAACELPGLPAATAVAAKARTRPRMAKRLITGRFL